MTEFTPLASLLGGIAIGAAASLLLIGSGKIAGISGIAANLLVGTPGDRAWRGVFILGLVLAGALVPLVWAGGVGSSPRPAVLVGAAGLVVGVGTRIGGGCTSGHGVCGVSRLSPRSLAATLTFIMSGVVTVAVLRWLGVGA